MMHRVPAVDEYTLGALSENLSIMAVDSITNKLLGKPSGLIKSPHHCVIHNAFFVWGDADFLFFFY